MCMSVNFNYIKKTIESHFRFIYREPHTISCVFIYSYIHMQCLGMGPKSKVRFNLFIAEVNLQ